MPQRAFGLGAQVVDAELEHPAQPARAAAAAVALERLRELPRAREALGERLLDGALEGEVGERAGEVDDGHGGGGGIEPLEPCDVPRAEVDPVDLHAGRLRTATRRHDHVERP